MMATQLDLFGTKAQRQLQADNERLRTRLENAKAEHRKLREERDRWRKSYQSLHKEYKTLNTSHQMQQAMITGLKLENTYLTSALKHTQYREVPLTKADLTKLLALCHPDKWSQGQAATALAHEISVALNGWRDRIGGQA